MPRRKQTPEQDAIIAHSDMQDALRASIGTLTVSLAELGMTDTLAAEGFQPIVLSWQVALTPRPNTQI